MSISAALSNALTGLSAAGRAGAVVSSNVANVMTEGYARREISLSAQSLGGQGAGVRVNGVGRVVNPPVLRERRAADAEAGNWQAQSAFLTRIESMIGEPGAEGSLSGRLARFESSLIEAQSRPDSTARLQSVLIAAQDLASTVNGIGRSIQEARSEADSSIEAQVGQLNADLARGDELNAEITAMRSLGRDANGLLDQRQTLVDRIAAIVPVREVPRENEQIALYTTGGAVLLEGNPARIGFSPVGVITADMAIGSAALSGLTINGMPIRPTDDGPLGGGTLGAAFAVRDALAPALQADIDAVARDLVTRFEASGIDPTRAPGDPGLLTDAGAVFDPLTETGLAGRLEVNALADPARGGALWRLRDGLGATVPGAVGDASLLAALHTAVTEQQPTQSGSLAGVSRTAFGFAADLLSRTATQRGAAEDRLAFSSGRQAALKELQMQDGVDTDAEMQKLLLVEQAYAANARVIQTMDDLITQLIGL